MHGVSVKYHIRISSHLDIYKANDEYEERLFMQLLLSYIRHKYLNLHFITILKEHN